MQTRNPISLDGKVAVVTGSGRGLGFEFAQSLALAGASVVVNDIDEAAVEQAVAAIRKVGGQAVGECVAVGTSEAADRLVAKAVDAFGRLDILCANAGILRDRVLWKLSDEDFDSVIATHLRGTFTCARAAVQQMRLQGTPGRLILVASPAGQRGNPGQTAYAAAKAGIAACARTWAMECAKAGITVNAIVPVALTQMLATIPSLAPLVDAAARGERLPDSIRKSAGMGPPSDVAPLVTFLASDEASHITGQCVGLGGDKLSLWSHPREIAIAINDGGWTTEAIAQLWPTTIGHQLESIGLPPMP